MGGQRERGHFTSLCLHSRSLPTRAKHTLASAVGPSHDKLCPFPNTVCRQKGRAEQGVGGVERRLRCSAMSVSQADSSTDDGRYDTRPTRSSPPALFPRLHSLHLTRRQEPCHPSLPQARPTAAPPPTLVRSEAGEWSVVTTAIAASAAAVHFAAAFGCGERYFFAMSHSLPRHARAAMKRVSWISASPCQ